MGCTDLPYTGVGTFNQCPPKSVASYLCHIMLTCGITFRCRHNKDRPTCVNTSFKGYSGNWSMASSKVPRNQSVTRGARGTTAADHAGDTGMITATSWDPLTVCKTLRSIFLGFWVFFLKINCSKLFLSVSLSLHPSSPPSLYL